MCGLGRVVVGGTGVVQLCVERWGFACVFGETGVFFVWRAEMDVFLYLGDMRCRRKESVYVCGKLTTCGYRDCLWVRENVEGETGLCVEGDGWIWKKIKVEYGRRQKRVWFNALEREMGYVKTYVEDVFLEGELGMFV